jgi:hypothetical protein
MVDSRAPERKDATERANERIHAAHAAGSATRVATPTTDYWNEYGNVLERRVDRSLGG